MNKVSKVKEFITGTLSGTIVGAFLGAVMIIVGLVLTSTVIGAIIGIPLIIVGAIFMLAGPFSGVFSCFSAIEGKCPYCGDIIKTLKTKKGVNCNSCKQRIIIRNGQYYNIEDAAKL